VQKRRTEFVSSAAPIRKPEWVPGNPNDRSVEGFRTRNGGARGPMSRSRYYKLKKERRAPRETHLGGLTIITPEDEAAWKNARANPKGTEERLIKRAAERRSDRARRAAAAAILSPKHPCNIKRRMRQQGA